MVKIEVYITADNEPDALLDTFEAEDEMELIKENPVVSRLIKGVISGAYGIRFQQIDDQGNPLD